MSADSLADKVFCPFPWPWIAFVCLSLRKETLRDEDKRPS